MICRCGRVMYQEHDWLYRCVHCYLYHVWDQEEKGWIILERTGVHTFGRAFPRSGLTPEDAVEAQIAGSGMKLLDVFEMKWVQPPGPATDWCSGYWPGPYVYASLSNGVLSNARLDNDGGIKELLISVNRHPPAVEARVSEGDIVTLVMRK